jgi:large subunit ribosomal protein L30
MASAVTISQRKSANGAKRRQRDTLRSLGLHGIGSSVERPDSPQLRGMIKAVAHLVEVGEGSSSPGDRESVRSKKGAKDDG